MKNYDPSKTRILLGFSLGIILFTSSFVPYSFSEPAPVEIEVNPGVKQQLDSFFDAIPNETPIQRSLQKEFASMAQTGLEFSAETRSERASAVISGHSNWEIDSEILSIDEMKKDGYTLGKKIETRTTLTFDPTGKPSAIDKAMGLTPIMPDDVVAFSKETIPEDSTESFEDICSQSGGELVANGESCDIKKGVIDNLTQKILRETEGMAILDSEGNIMEITGDKIFKDETNPDGIDFDSLEQVHEVTEVVTIEFDEEIISQLESANVENADPSLSTQGLKIDKNYALDEAYQDPLLGGLLNQVLPPADASSHEQVIDIDMIMGFTFAPPSSSWTPTWSSSSCITIDLLVSIIPWVVERKTFCTEWFKVTIGYEFDIAAAFRLPVTVQFIAPTFTTPDKRISIKAKIIQKDFTKQEFVDFCNEARNPLHLDPFFASCDRYALENDVWEEDGNEVAANLIARVFSDACALNCTIPIIDFSFGTNIDFVEKCTEDKIKDYLDFDIVELATDQAARDRLNTIFESLFTIIQGGQGLNAWLKENNLECSTFKTPYGKDPATNEIMEFPFVEGSSISVPAACGISTYKIMAFIFTSDDPAAAAAEVINKIKTGNTAQFKSPVCTRINYQLGEPPVAVDIGLGAAATIVPRSSLISATFSNYGDSLANSKVVDFVARDSDGNIDVPQQLVIDGIVTGEYDAGTNSVLIDLDSFQYKMDSFTFTVFVEPQVAFTVGLSYTIKFPIEVFSTSKSLGIGLPILSQHALTGPATIAIPIDYSLNFQVPPDQVVSADPNNPLTPVNVGVPNALGNPLSFTRDNNANSFPVGENVITWTATHTNGRTATDIQIIKVIDTTAPELVPPRDVIVEGTGLVTPKRHVDLGTPLVRDSNCPCPTSNDIPPGLPLGDTVVTWTATDSSGNTATATQLVTVVDTVAPVIREGLDSREFTGTQNPAPVQYIEGFVDIFDAVTKTFNNVFFAGKGSLVAQSPTIPDLNPLTTTEFNCLAGVYIFFINQDDYCWTDPVFDPRTPDLSDITCDFNAVPEEQHIDSRVYQFEWFAGDPVVPELALFDKSCYSQEPVVTRNIVSFGDPFLGFTQIPIGVHEVLWRVIDAAGNIGEKRISISVRDVGPPVVTPPPDLTLEAGSNLDFIEPDDLGMPTATDGVDGQIFDITSDFNPDNLQLGPNIVTYTARDNAGNVGSAPQTLTLQDTTPPVFIFGLTLEELVMLNPEDLVQAALPTLEVEATGLKTSIDDVPLDMVNAVDAFPVTVDSNAPNEFPVGTTVIQWTAVDSSGNTADATQEVKIIDTTPPTVLTKDITVELDNVGGASIIPEDVENGSFDRVGIASLSLDKSFFTGADLGDNVVTLTVTDTSGNSASAQAIVTVIDIIPPLIVLNGENPVELIAGENYDESGAIVTDNSGEDLSGSLIIDDSDVDTSNPGTYLVTYNVSDSSGNPASQVTRTVNVISAVQAVDDIIDLIESKTFSKNVENSLLGPLKKITKILADSNPDNDEATCGKLTEFIDTVDEKESSGKLSPDDADELREAAQRIQNVLGC